MQNAKKDLERSEKELGVEQVNFELLTFEQDNAKRMAEYIKGDLGKEFTRTNDTN